MRSEVAELKKMVITTKSKTESLVTQVRAVLCIHSTENGHFAQPVYSNLEITFSSNTVHTVRISYTGYKVFAFHTHVACM